MNMPRLDAALIEQVTTTIRDARNIAIISHTNADGDAVGSLLGTYHILSGLFSSRAGASDTALTPMLPNGVPETFRYLPGADLVLSGDLDREACEHSLATADLVICVDFNTAPRVDHLCDALTASSARKLMLDHHHGPDTELIDVMVSVPELSSACELVYWTMTACFGQECISRDAARCLYNGICTDTGSFAFSNEDPSVYEAAASLVKHDIGAADIHNHIDNTFSINKMKFWGWAICNRLKIFEDKKFAYFYFSMKDLEEGRVTSAELEGLVSYTLKMKVIEVGALVREEHGRTKVSLRSKYDVDVNQIARTHFGGGGHTKASGATCTGWTLDETCRKIEEVFVIGI